MNSSTSWPWSRKYSAIVSPDSATRMRAPGGSFIWPNTSIVLSMHARFLHLQPQVVALARALAHAAERRQPAVLLGEVVDQLLDQHRLADARAAEQPDLAALRVGREQVDHLDARLEHLGRRRQILHARRVLVDLAALGVRGQLLAEVDRFAQQVEDPPQRRLAHRHRDRAARVDHLDAAREPVGRVHRHRAHAIVAEVLLDLAHEHLAAGLGADARSLLLRGGRGTRDRDRVVDLGQRSGNTASMTTPWISSMRPTLRLLARPARSPRARGRSEGSIVVVDAIALSILLIVSVSVSVCRADRAA